MQPGWCACAHHMVSIDLPLVDAYRGCGWAALADPTRRAIFERLADHPQAVGQLAADLPVSRPAVSQHLKVLRAARLVVDQQVGTGRVYRVDPDGLHALRSQLDAFWNKALTAYARAVEEHTKEGRMTSAAQQTSVRMQVVVDAPIESAFRVFTEDFDRIKPHEHNLLQVPIAETVFERRVGGYIYDRGVDGNVCRWARVLAYEPPNRVVFSWDITPQWQIETDPQKTSEVEVRFTAEAPERTRVEVWNIATSSAMATAGRASAIASPAREAGRCTSTDSPRSSRPETCFLFRAPLRLAARAPTIATMASALTEVLNGHSRTRSGTPNVPTCERLLVVSRA